MISAEITLILVLSDVCLVCCCCYVGRGVTVGRVNVLVIPGSHHFTVGFSLSCAITYYNEVTPLGADIP